MREPVTHFFPNARVLIVKGFGNDQKLESAQLIQVDLKSVLSIRTMRTVRNQPGTFSLTLMDTENKFQKRDNPVGEIPILRTMSQTQLSRQKSVETVTPLVADSSWTTDEEQRKTLAQNLGIPFIPQPTATTQRLLTTTSRVSNVYEFETYDDWKDFEWIILVEEGTGERLVTYYQRNRSGEITKRWAIDRFGRLITLPATLAAGDVREFTDEVGKKRRFTVQKFANDLFLTRFTGVLDHGRCLIEPMDRIVIFFKRRFVKTGDRVVEQQASSGELIRDFTGVVNRVGVQYTESFATVTVDGEDVTKWLKMSVVNVNPAQQGKYLTTTDPLAPKLDGSIPLLATNYFAHFTPPEIVKFLTLGSSGIDDRRVRERLRTEGIKFPEATGVGVYKLAGDNRRAQWVFDVGTGQYIRKDTKFAISTANVQPILGTLFTRNAVHVIDVSKFIVELFTPYRFDFSGWAKFQSDYRDRRELCYEVASQIGFFFYADRNGELWFTPQRLSNVWIFGQDIPEVYVIDKQSILSYTLLDDDTRMYTNVIVTTEADAFNIGKDVAGLTTAIYQDDALVMKYGTRVLTMHNPLLVGKDTATLFFYGKHKLQQLLADKLQGQVVITGRPDIDEGYPVYIPHLNKMFLAEAVETSLGVGQDFTTTLSLTYGRKPWDFAPEFLTFGNDLMWSHSEIASRRHPVDKSQETPTEVTPKLYLFPEGDTQRQKSSKTDQPVTKKRHNVPTTE